MRHSRNTRFVRDIEQHSFLASARGKAIFADSSRNEEPADQPLKLGKIRRMQKKSTGHKGECQPLPRANSFERVDRTHAQLVKNRLAECGQFGLHILQYTLLYLVEFSGNKGTRSSFVSATTEMFGNPTTA